MTDKELIKLAAKAVGIIHPGGEHSVYNDGRVWDCKDLRWWNPLADDGDALRLAAKLQIDLDWQETSGFPEPTVEAYRKKWDDAYFCASEDKEHYRRAIVRAAAEIGRSIP